MRVIMVPVANRPESKISVNISAGLAQQLGADIIGLHLRAHRRPKGKPVLVRNLQIDSQSEGAFIAKDSHAAAQAAERMFVRVVVEHGLKISKRTKPGAEPAAQWLEKVGSPDKVMSILGPLADLIVVSRPAANGHVARAFLLAALFCSRRPVLVLPQKQKKIPGKRIAIAWNQSIEASGVVTDSIALLQQAEEVNLIICGKENRLGPSSAQLKDYLAHWGVDAGKIKTRGKNPSAELMAAYRESGSDLLMMGAYSRSRFREVIFGGITEQMLWHETIPLLLQHD